MKQRYSALAGGMALSVLAHAASAQTAEAPKDEAPAAVKSPSQASVLDRVTVTATKREQRLQDVPVSVSFVDGAQLTRQNVNEVADLVRSVPSLNASGPFGALSIRGIGSVSYSRSSEGSVGVVVDNVSLAGTSTNPPQLFDISRVEVLNGPQGTLFGRNSSAGLVNIITNAPDPKKFEAFGHADIGTRDTRTGRAGLNIPLSDTAALRLSGAYAQAPETLKNLFDGTSVLNKDLGGRARFLWAPDERVKVNLIADYTRASRSDGAPWAVYQSTPTLATALAACGVTVGAENDSGCVNGGNRATVNSYGYSGQIDYKLGDHTLSSITAYRGVKANTTAYDIDSLPATIFSQLSPSDVHNVSQEFRLTSPSGDRFEYVAGLYYSDSKFDGSTTLIGPIAKLLGDPRIYGLTLATQSATTSYAAFGQGTLHVTEEFGLNVGVRYGKEKVAAQSQASLPAGATRPAGGLAGLDAATSDDYVSFRMGAQYAFTPDTLAYASYTRGYKGPAVNDQGGGTSLLVRPEVPHAAELGLKGSLLDGRVVASAAVFYTRIDDFQTQIFDPTTRAFVFENAPSALSKGIEFNLLGRPLKSVTLNLGAVYTKASYGPGYTVKCGQLQTAAEGCNTAAQTTDATGHQLVGSPKWKLTFSGEYATSVFGRYVGFVQADAVYRSTTHWNAAYDPSSDVAGATIVGGRLGLRTDDGNFGVSLFVRNLFDTYRAAVRFDTPITNPYLLSKSYSQGSGSESHRVIGVSVDARF